MKKESLLIAGVLLGLLPKTKEGSRAKIAKVGVRKGILTYWTESDSEIKTNSIPVKKLGKGRFTTAYQGLDDGLVYLVTLSDVGPGMINTKEMIADMNLSNGPQRHIPEMEQIGWTEMGKWGGITVDCTVYRSIIYKTPLRRNHSEKAWIMRRELVEAKTFAWDRNVRYPDPVVRNPRVRSDILGYLEDAKVPKGLTQDDWDGLIKAITKLAQISEDYGNMMFEFPIRNLATDADGNLILLDVLFNPFKF